MKVQKQLKIALNYAGVQKYQFAAENGISTPYLQMILKKMDGELKKPMTSTPKTEAVKEAILAFIERYSNVMVEMEEAQEV